MKTIQLHEFPKHLERHIRRNIPGETISLPVSVQASYGAQEYQTCTDTALSGYQLHLGR